jgi:hypothetical protein
VSWLQVSWSDASRDKAGRLGQTAGIFGDACSLESSLEAGVPEETFRFAEQASKQWTGRFNPRPFGIQEALEVYEWAF